MIEEERGNELSPRTVEAVTLWLMNLNAQSVQAEPMPSTSELVRYLSGALPPYEISRVEKAVLTHPASRKTLRVVRMELLRLEALPWAEVGTVASGDGLSAEIAAAWLVLVAERIAAAEQLPARWLKEGWRELYQHFLEAAVEASIAWSTFIAFRRHWASTPMIPRPAFVRGSGEELAERQSVDLGEEVSCRAWFISALNSEGSLAVSLSLEDESGDAVTIFDGRALRLSLKTGTELWPLGEAVIEKGKAGWTLDEFAAVMKVSAEKLHANSFHIVFADEEETADRLPASLRVDVLDSAGRIADKSFHLSFMDWPHWKGGQFFARVELPQEMLQRYPSFQLRLEITVSGDHNQQLGAWTLAGENDSPRTLKASCPGSPDSTLSNITLIRAQLRPPQ